MSVISILMVDDHPVVLEGYSRLLERQGGFRVCAQADSAARAYQSFKDHQPDVVIMDLGLPGAGGLEAVRQIREWEPQARILIFTMHLSAAFALKAFEAGAVGYLTKTSEPGELVKAVAAVANGRRFLSEDVARALAAERLSATANPIGELGPRATEIFPHACFRHGHRNDRTAPEPEPKEPFATTTTQSRQRSARATMQTWYGRRWNPVSSTPACALQLKSAVERRAPTMRGNMPGADRAMASSLPRPSRLVSQRRPLGNRARTNTQGDIMCTLHPVSFLDRAELIDGVQALISKAKSPELREFHVFDLTGTELPWKDLGINLTKGQEVTFLLGGRVWLSREQDLWVEPGVAFHVRTRGSRPHVQSDGQHRNNDGWS